MSRALIWPTALLIVSALAWGLMFSLNRLAVVDGIPQIAYVFWMGTGAAILLLGAGVVQILRGAVAAREALPRLGWAHLRGYLVLGTISFGLSYTIFAYAAPKVPAGVIGLGATLTPILTYPAAAALKMDRFSALRTLGLVIGVGGVVLVLAPETSLPTRDMVPWVLLALTVPLLYVANAIIIALIAPPPSGALPLAGGILTVGALFMFVVMAATGQWWWFDGPMTVGDWALIAASATIALAFFLMIEIIRIAGPVFFTSVNFMIPLTGIGWGVVFFDERHSVWIWLALALMLVGLVLVNRRPRAEVASQGEEEG